MRLDLTWRLRAIVRVWCGVWGWDGIWNYTMEVLFAVFSIDSSSFRVV